jgi:predicted amidohydrolase
MAYMTVQHTTFLSNPDTINSMKLSIAQFTPDYGNKSENFRRIRAHSEHMDADVLVFPELCTTGYFFQRKEESRLYAETLAGETVEFFRGIARMHDAMVIAGFVESGTDGDAHGGGSGSVYNSALIVSPNAPVQVYRKTHLFYKERFAFDEGNTGFFVVPHHRVDANIGTMICYDWRFPEAARALGLKGADVIVCPSNLVTNVWHLAMPARALENKVYVAVPNRAGKETRQLEGSSDNQTETVRFTGKSVIYDFNGTVIAQAGAEDDEILSVEIDPTATRNKSFNALNDIFTDRRPAVYEL